MLLVRFSPYRCCILNLLTENLVDFCLLSPSASSLHLRCKLQPQTASISGTRIEEDVGHALMQVLLPSEPWNWSTTQPHPSLLAVVLHGFHEKSNESLPPQEWNLCLPEALNYTLTFHPNRFKIWRVFVFTEGFCLIGATSRWTPPPARPGHSAAFLWGHVFGLLQIPVCRASLCGSWGHC